MITCPHCGRELEDGAKFCNGCGAQMEEAAPVVEETPVVESTPVQTIEPKENPSNGILEKVKALPKKAIAIGCGVVVVVILVIALLTSILGGTKEPNYTVYLKDDELQINMLNGKESIEITSKFAGDYYEGMELYNRAYNLVSVTPDEKTVIYPDKFDDNNYAFDLYYRSTTKEKDEAEKIASGVSSYVLSDDGKKIVYLCEKGLYEYDFKDSAKVDSEVYNYWTTEDCKTILWQDNEGTLYKKTFGKDNEEKLEKDVSVNAVSADLNTVVFTKEDKLYIKEGTKDKVKIDSDVSSVIMAYESGEVYYTKTEDETTTLDQYVEDDMASQDAAMVEPVYPSYYDFEWPQYPSYWAEGWKEQEEYATCETWDEAYELYETLYDEVDAEYDAAYDAYYDAYEIWSEKEDRDYIRESMSSWEIEITKTSLYFFDGKESVCVVEDFSNSSSVSRVSASDQEPVIVIEVEEAGEVQKFKLSEIDSIYNISYEVEDMLEASATPAVVSGSKVTMIETEDASNILLSTDAKTVFFYTDVEDYYTGTLYKTSVANGKAEKIDENVVVGYVASDEDGNYLYCKDVSDSYYVSGEIYLNGKSIADDVVLSTLRTVDADLTELYYIKDMDESEGTLCFNDGKEQNIAKDVFFTFTVTADGGVLYFKDYDEDDYCGDLFYSENGKEGTEVDDDVTIVLQPYMYIY